MKKSFILNLLTFLFISSTTQAEICGTGIFGKIDIGPAYAVIDVLESGRTEHTRYLKGFKGDATIVLWKGIFIKPNILWGEGNARLTAGGIGIGQCLPINDCLTLLPSVGINFSYFRTKIDVEEVFLFDLTEKFRSSSPYICMEFTYKITPKWILMGMYQYAWSHTKTTIDPIISDKSHTCGPNYALGIEYCMNDNWSLTFGVGYNITLSKEKHGLRGKGAKLGLAYYF